MRSMLAAFSFNLLRQKTLTTIAGYIAEFLGRKEPEELASLAEAGGEIVEEIKADLQKKLPEYRLEQMAELAAPYAEVVRPQDFDTILERVNARLPASHTDVFQEHYRWYWEQMNKAWEAFLKMLSKEVKE